MMSEEPPGGYGTIIRTGLDGHADCADAAAVAKAAEAASIWRRVIMAVGTSCCPSSYNNSGETPMWGTRTPLLGCCCRCFLGAAQPLAAVRQVQAHRGARGL